MTDKKEFSTDKVEGIALGLDIAGYSDDSKHRIMVEQLKVDPNVARDTIDGVR